MSDHHQQFLGSSRRTICTLLLVLAASISFSAAAHADDARETVRQAAKALVNAPAFRMVATYTDTQGRKLQTVTLECVRPDAADLRYEQDGRITMETIVVGHKSYVWLPTEQKFKEFPVDSSGVFTRMQSASLQTINEFRSVILVGHQTLNGEPASIYKLVGTIDGSRSNTQMWISDRSRLPLKADATASMAVKELHGRVVQQHVATTFTYGSSLRIAPPKT